MKYNAMELMICPVRMLKTGLPVGTEQCAAAMLAQKTHAPT